MSELDDLASAAASTDPSPDLPAPRRRNVPAYTAITVGANVLRVFGAIYIAVGLLMLAGALMNFSSSANATGSTSAERDLAATMSGAAGVAGLLVGGSVITGGLIILMFGSLAIAVRDIARNSWRR